MPLSGAVMNGHEADMTLLVEEGAAVESNDKHS
jgi:hypothetical protein